MFLLENSTALTGIGRGVVMGCHQGVSGNSGFFGLVQNLWKGNLLEHFLQESQKSANQVLFPSLSTDDNPLNTTAQVTRLISVVFGARTKTVSP